MSKRLKYTKDILTHLLHANAAASGGQAPAAASGSGVPVNAGVKKIGAAGEIMQGGAVPSSSGQSTSKNQVDKGGKMGATPGQQFISEIK